MDNFNALMIGEKAPAFKANSTYGMVSFPDDYKGKWVVFFSHPGDFTPVCTTEIMTFASMVDEFGSLGCSLLGLSVDSNPSHIAWVRAMNKYQWKNIKDVKVTFPIIADDFGNVARMYGMLMPAASMTKTVRTVFIIDPNGVIRAILIYPLTTGRNLQEIKRLVIALQAFDATGNPTPCNWVPPEEQVFPAPQTLIESQKRLDGQSANGYYCLDWYICFVKSGSKPQPMPYSAEKTSPPEMTAMPGIAMADKMLSNYMTGSGIPGIMPENVRPAQSNIQSAMPPVMTQPMQIAPSMPTASMQMPIPQQSAQQMPASQQMPMNNSSKAAVRTQSAAQGMTNTAGKKNFTTAELSRYNGKMGMPAYGAVNGVVYDLTSIMDMSSHMGLKAGTDLTKEFAKCHMGKSYLLSKLPVMGTYNASTPTAAATTETICDEANDFMITRDYPSGKTMM